MNGIPQPALYGFHMRDLYPGFGGMTTVGRTIPEAEEQQALAVVEGPRPQPPVEAATKRAFWLGMAVIIGVVGLIAVAR